MELASFSHKVLEKAVRGLKINILNSLRNLRILLLLNTEFKPGKIVLEYPAIQPEIASFKYYKYTKLFA